jgi:lipid-A-disaccharide synthase
MAAAGVASPFDVADISILGFLEGLRAYPRIVRRADEAAAIAAREKPDVAVLIDSWGFTLRVAQRLRRLDPGLALIKYVGPQVWATRPGRAKTLARAVDHLLSIHRFDAPFFEAEGLPVTFVGNSALSLDFSNVSASRLRKDLAIGATAPVLLVTPGSRPGEIEHMLPVFEDAVSLLKQDRQDLQVIVPAAPTVAEMVKSRVAGWRHRVHVVEGEAAKLAAMKAATVALACSGTVTTELALAGAPMVIGYRMAPLTAFMIRRLLRTPYITLFNIAAQDFVAPELIQEDCIGPKLAHEVALRLDDAELRGRQVLAQYAALDRMGRGGPDPSEAAADAVLRIVEAKRARAS